MVPLPNLSFSGGLAGPSSAASENSFGDFVAFGSRVNWLHIGLAFGAGLVLALALVRK